ncbi:hypothetical protein H0E87_009349 [Populus deltoides]|uniref:non-specific serine/threonine protein kinase n=1 Tax=Populus deltoides TaxID=3696 RepID=A0A8T2Z403_POPDE|nr:hypothetical protein H0E87_009349 [Populus deltoides]
MKIFPCCRSEREEAPVDSTSCTDKESAKHGRALSFRKNMSWKIGSSKRKNNLKVFTYHELSVETNDFNPSCSVGEDLPPGRKPLDWTSRMKIATGAAQGLEHLHDTADPQIIYRDFKASNILLDGNFNAKLSDFGFAKLGPTGGKDHVSTRVMGTYGYCAPEYQLTGPLSKDRSKFTAMADPLLEGKYQQKSLYQALAIAAMCLQEEADTRPLMTDVVTALEFLAGPIE